MQSLGICIILQFSGYLNWSHSKSDLESLIIGEIFFHSIQVYAETVAL